MTGFKAALAGAGAGMAMAALAAPSLAATAADWASNNRDPGAQRFSPLTQITPANVTALRQAWVYHLKPAPASGELL